LLCWCAGEPIDSDNEDDEIQLDVDAEKAGVCLLCLIVCWLRDRCTRSSLPLLPLSRAGNESRFVNDHRGIAPQPNVEFFRSDERFLLAAADVLPAVGGCWYSQVLLSLHWRAAHWHHVVQSDRQGRRGEILLLRVFGCVDSLTISCAVCVCLRVRAQLLISYGKKYWEAQKAKRAEARSGKSGSSAGAGGAGAGSRSAGSARGGRGRGAGSRNSDAEDSSQEWP
jgi:hypothetical protein